MHILFKLKIFSEIPPSQRLKLNSQTHNFVVFHSTQQPMQKKFYFEDLVAISLIF